MDGTKLDWATAEALALGSLLAEGMTFLYSCTMDRGCIIRHLLFLMPAVLSYSYLVSFLLTREVLRCCDSSYLKTLFNHRISHVDSLHQQVVYGNTGFRADCIGKIFSLVIVGQMMTLHSLTVHFDYRVLNMGQVHFKKDNLLP